MLRRCEKYRLDFVNEVDEVRCFGAGPCSNRRACVEDKRERESMLDSQNDRARKATEEVPLSGSMYRSSSCGLRVFVSDVPYGGRL